MNPNMTLISQVTDFKTGDIVITKSVVPFVQHYAIAFYRDGIPMIADNSFINKQINVYTYDEYKKSRTILGIVRNECTLNITDAKIEQAVKDWSPIKYNFFGFTNNKGIGGNCEDFTASFGCNHGTDQRVKWGIGILIVIILILLISK